MLIGRSCCVFMNLTFSGPSSEEKIYHQLKSHHLINVTNFTSYRSKSSVFGQGCQIRTRIAISQLSEFSKLFFTQWIVMLRKKFRKQQGPCRNVRQTDIYSLWKTPKKHFVEEFYKYFNQPHVFRYSLTLERLHLIPVVDLQLPLPGFFLRVKREVHQTDKGILFLIFGSLHVLPLYVRIAENLSRRQRLLKAKHERENQL